jgi:cystathionine beta-lyase/cystathionine gamma-synthase
VTPALGDTGYDLLVGRSDSVKRVVVKYQKSGLLKAEDIDGVAQKAKPDVATAIVTNVAVSPYAVDQLELSADARERSYVSRKLA